MPRHDWVLGTDRNAEALARILSAASELVSRKGFEAFTVEAVAAELHCSPATVYRRTGGKAAILERLVSLFAQRIVGAIREAITGLEGTERVVAAIVVALDCMRAEPLGKLIMGDIRPDHDSGTVTASPLVGKFAAEMIGSDDPLAAQWLIRVTFALWYWPLKDKQSEYELVRRFAGPSVTLGLGEATPT
ncbi:helix-turn-helix domain-containing protein [Mycolicibacterium sp. 141076]|uniref:TetR/AcrR family transcriptional regulator n=1 Tax=Mycobacteriaceae TaxID=1762 RepID=UPI00299DF943|nr:helix-turn-helix domain-containing protein [Mycolicibacterium sp. 141076]MDX1880706.1 helix-turn-helix domain-containing protein [Mycolicibacterium sp. 141076]